MEESERRAARADHGGMVMNRVLVVFVVEMIGMLMKLRQWLLLPFVPMFADRPMRSTQLLVFQRQ